LTTQLSGVYGRPLRWTAVHHRCRTPTVFFTNDRLWALRSVNILWSGTVATVTGSLPLSSDFLYNDGTNFVRRSAPSIAVFKTLWIIRVAIKQASKQINNLQLEKQTSH